MYIFWDTVNPSLGNYVQHFNVDVGINPEALCEEMRMVWHSPYYSGHQDQHKWHEIDVLSNKVKWYLQNHLSFFLFNF